MSDCARDDSQLESLRILSSLLDRFASGSGRITPRVRGSRLDSDVLLKLEKAVAAVEMVGKSLASPNNLMIFGNGCYAIGRHEDASSAYLKILKDEPANADARFNLGLAYLRLRRPEDAVREFTDLLVQQPMMPEAFYQRGNGNDDLGELDQALADYSLSLIHISEPTRPY